MGSFNITGFYSHLSIEPGDEVGVIVCANVSQGFANEGLPIEPSDCGIIPMLPVVKGKYSDYGEADIPEDDKLNVVFKKVSGISINEFQDILGRNHGVSISTEDNGNHYDDIPGFQKVIQNFIPELKGKTKKYNDKDLDKLEDQMYNHYKKVREKATFLVIIEHWSVIEALKVVGEGFSNYVDYDGTKIDNPGYFDLLTGYAEEVKKKTGHGIDIFDSLELYRTNDIDLMTRHMKDLAPRREQHFFKLHGYTGFELGVLKKAKDWISWADYKEDILSSLYLERGLHFLGGTYCPSCYDGQEEYWEKHKSVQSVIQEIINKKIIEHANDYNY